jgi:hypothetical protein
MIEQATSAIVGLGILIALAYLIYGPWQWVCTDFARQIIFEKRDAIFDMAADGDLNFNSSEYRTIRSSLESSIRFAHELSLPYFLLMLLVRKGSISEKSHLVTAVDQIQNAFIREQVRRKVNVAQRALVVMMAAKSPILVFLFLPALVLGAGIYFIEKCHAPARRVVNIFGELVQVEAEFAPTEIQIGKDRRLAAG